jgi:hypothetical protein
MHTGDMMPQQGQDSRHHQGQGEEAITLSGLRLLEMTQGPMAKAQDVDTTDGAENFH